MSQDFSLVQLRAFATVARTGSFRRAADELSYSSPAVYLQVRSLENALGLPLVHREGQSMTLTWQGERLKEAIEEILAKTDNLLHFSKGMIGAHVQIGTGHHSELIVPVMAEYLASQTRFSVDLQTLSRGGLAAALTKGSLDIVIGGRVARTLYAEYRDRYALSLAHWMHDEWVLVGNDPNQLEEREASRQSDRVPHFFLPDSSTTAQWILDNRVIREYSTAPRVTMIESTLAILSAAMNGLGLALLPLSRAQNAINYGQLQVLRRFGEHGRVPIYLLHRRSQLLSPATKDFIGFLVSRRRSGSWAGTP